MLGRDGDRGEGGEGDEAGRRQKDCNTPRSCGGQKTLKCSTSLVATRTPGVRCETDDAAPLGGIVGVMEGLGWGEGGTSARVTR